MEDSKETEYESTSERIWLISENSTYSGLIGLINCLRQEPSGHRFRCVYNGRETKGIPKFSLTSPFYRQQIEKNLVMNVYQDGKWGSFRHILCNEDSTHLETEHAYMNILTVGDLSSFAWIESPLKYFTPTEDAVLCHVYYASLNFRDVMSASGKLPLLAVPDLLAIKDCLIGFEFSGRTVDGKRVMCSMSHKAIATTVAVHPSLLMEVPDDWTLEEAATIPVAYSTAYYALIMKANLEKSNKILIHSGSGGVGQAAVAIALHMGCEVFTSVGSEEKKDFMKRKFPQLDDRHFCNSRDTTFEQHILQETNGEGVNVVLNSLAEDKLFASLNCLAFGGQFLEIGKYDLVKNSQLGMSAFLNGITFHGISLDKALTGKNRSPKILNCLSELLKQGILDGVVKPLNTTVFNYDQAEQAFRYMASGRHTGKVLLKIRKEEKKKLVIPTPIRVQAIIRTAFDPKKSYIIIGGLGGLGMELCDFLIERGAKNIILTSRSGITTGYHELCIHRWKTYTENIIISKLNASKCNEAKDLIKLAMEYGPVGGIFNLALVLRDDFMENQTVDKFTEVCDAKVVSTKNLDMLSRKLCPELEWFVCFSSISSGRGNAAQTNYGYANSVMERICETRKREGLPGLAIQWGAVGDVGVVHETMGNDIKLRGTVPQRINSCLKVLDKFLQDHHPVVSSVVLYKSDGASNLKFEKGDLFSNLASIFGIKDLSAINPEATLVELGMDSLMGIELKQILEINFNIVRTISELRQMKVKELKNLAKEGTLDSLQESFENASLNVTSLMGQFHTLTSKDLVPEETIIHMNEIKKGSPLFVIPPIEGSVFMLKSVVESLPMPVYGIQFTKSSPKDSIECFAAWNWEIIKSFVSTTESIYLLGYSFGTTVAFEMALQREQDVEQYPQIKNLFCLDGSQNFLTHLTHRIATHIADIEPDVEGQIGILYVFSKMIDEETHLDTKHLKNLKNFEERIRYTADKIAETCSNYYTEDLQIAFNLFIKKLEMVFKYSPKHKLQSDVYLFKASESMDMMKTISKYYDLEKVCEGKIATYTIDSNHYNIVEGDSAKAIAKIIDEIVSM